MIARVFPRKTNATPTDDFAFYGPPPMFLDDVDEAHVSCTFTYDKQYAEWLAEQWGSLGITVKIGGPAYDDFGSDFHPGMYLKPGYVITSRGCNNHCWFCKVPKREGRIRELPISDGWNVLDSNLLQCSEAHIRAVFAMLKKQDRKAEFTGGLEAKILKSWHVDLLADLKPKQMFFAYDTPDDLEPLIEAGNLLKKAGFNFRHLRCHVLMGFKGDTIQKAEKRLWKTVDSGFMPSAMVFMDNEGKKNIEWAKFQRSWQRPAAIMTTIKTARKTNQEAKIYST